MALLGMEHDPYDYIKKKLLPAGTASLGGALLAYTYSGTTYYEIVVYLPIPAADVTITCNELRPSGQSAVKDTSPSIAKNGNAVTISTTNASFASYVGKLTNASLTFSYT